MTTATRTTFRVEFRDGFSADGHFGREIAARIAAGGNDFATLAEARAALKRHRSEHGSGCRSRFDLVASDGRRWIWE